jgi:predicted nucleic acid-binding protein
VLCEPRQKRPDSKVIQWLEENEPNLYTSVLVMGEIRYGVQLLPQNSRRRTDLLNWYEKLAGIMAGRILSVNFRVCEEWARVQAEAQTAHVSLPVVDSLLAATARRYQLIIATENESDFKFSGVRVLNPFA